MLLVTLVVQTTYICEFSTLHVCQVQGMS